VWDGSQLARRRPSSAIWFLFLPVVDIAHGEDLYIKDELAREATDDV
jgi:hypothetical protein